MTTNDEGMHKRKPRHNERNVDMTARRTTRKTVSADIAVEDTATIVPDTAPVIESPDAVPAPSNRKYMSHENCDHARKGEAGKAARQVCRRNHRAWFAAEAEWLASQESDAIAV